VVISQGIYPSYSDIDTYHMAACCIDTAIRNAVVAGANIDHLALLDNFCWCSSGDSERLGQLKRACKACYDYTLAFQTPLISGKDSMFNDFKGFDENGKPIKISIPPTLLISSIGVIDDVLKSVSIDLKFPGDLIYIIGETFDELGGSEYYSMNNYTGNKVPQVNAKKNRKLYQDFYKCVKSNLISSAISIGRGGLGVATVKTAIAGMLGIDISLKNIPGKYSRDDFTLFSESQGRIIVSINPILQKSFEKLMEKNTFAKIGMVTSQKSILIKNSKDKNIVNLNLNSTFNKYKSVFKNF
jgi:phosphoribosylformylglycinamidine synthase